VTIFKQIAANKQVRQQALFFLFFVFSKISFPMTIRDGEEEQDEPMLRHDDLVEQINHMEPLAVGGKLCVIRTKAS
jgi:hypothetical protein